MRSAQEVEKKMAKQCQHETLEFRGAAGWIMCPACSRWWLSVGVIPDHPEKAANRGPVPQVSDYGFVARDGPANTRVVPK